jgi:AcrR family transcriptional regulator
MPSATTKERILDAAERLFAEKGVDATSLRQVTGAAGVNVAAIHYHFGSKEELLRAVIGRRFDPVNQERMKQLDRLETADVPPDVEAILRAFLEPALDTLDALGEQGSLLARLVARIYSDASEPLKNVLVTQFGGVFARFAEALMTALPELPPAEVVLRFQYTAGVLHQSLSIIELPVAELSPVELPTLDTENMLQRMVSFVAAGLRAPLSPQPGRAS